MIEAYEQQTLDFCIAIGIVLMLGSIDRVCAKRIRHKIRWHYAAR